MGICTSRRNHDIPMQRDQIRRTTQQIGQERQSIKLNNKPYQATRTPKLTRTLSSNQMNEKKKKQKIGPFELQKGFFKKYSVLKIQDSALYCEQNLTAQETKVTILDTKSANNNSFFQLIQQYDLKCINICQYIESYQEKDKIYLVQENLKGGNLSHILKKKHLTYHQAVIIIEQIINAVHHLHSQNLSHGSLTNHSFIFSDPDNLLIKLQDLGPIFHYEPPDSNNETKKQLILQYKSPENKKSSKSDVWAIGIIFYQLITSEILKIPTDYAGILNWDPSSGLNLPKEGAEGLLDMLQYDSQKRCSLKNIMDKGYFKNQINKETLENCITQLAQLRKMTNLQSLLILFMMNTFQMDQVQILSRVFQQGDLDNDGSLSKNELKNLFKHISLDESLINETIDSLFLNIDILNDKGLTRDQFISLACNKRELLIDFNLENCFKLLSNNKGDMTVKSIGRIITLGDESEIRGEINEISYDQLDLEKFSEFMKEVL